MIRFLKHKFRLIANIFHLSQTILFIIKNKFSFFFRSQKRIDYSNEFAKYIYNDEKLKEFLKWFNEKDKEFIIKILNKIKIVLNNNIIPNKILFDKKDKEWYKKFMEFSKTNKIELNHFDKQTDLSNFYYIPRTLEDLNINNFFNKDILDCWAFIGDSSYTFSKHCPNSKIYAFEPNNSNFIKLNETIKLFNKENQIIPVKKWVSKESGIAYINDDWAGSTIWMWNNKIEITSIDEFVLQNNLNPWIIKRDIEWLEYESILGTIKTLERFKPILLISIYHNARDFFEIKPIIENLNLWYKFKIAKWSDLPPLPITEMILVCY